MAETRTYQGQTYTRNAPGEPWVLVSPSAPPRGVVIADPYRAAEESRKAAEEKRRQQDQAFEAERLRIAQQQAAIAAQSAGISAQKDAREAQAMEARGGVDTTESERTAAFLATRLAGGLRDLRAIGGNDAPSLFEVTAGQTTIGNLANDEEWQRVLNAQRDIIDAALTLGTGAAYTAEQIDSYRKSYFPQPGDKPATIADKRRRLETLLNASRIKSGAAAGMIDEALASTKLFETAEATSGRLSPEQQRLYDAVMAANPTANAEQLTAAFSAANVPPPTNLAEIIAARDSGAGVAPASSTIYQESLLGQGMSGVNEGIASTLGLPADAMAWAMNLVPQGINAVANTDIPTISDPFLGGDWWKDRFSGWGIYDPTDDTSSQFVRRVGQSVGSAALPVGGAASTARQGIAGLLSATSGGVGAATSQALAPGNVGLEIAAELLGSGGAGLGLAAIGRKSAQRSLEEAIPTVPQLKEQAGELYRRAEDRGVTAGPAETQQLADDVAAALRNEGRISPTGRLSEVYPKAKEGYQLINDYAGQPMNPTQMQTIRSVISEGQASAEPAERRIAKLLLDTYDDFVDPLAPDLSDARSVASRYLNAEKLETARELAESDASRFTQSGSENALRGRYRQLDRNAIQGRGRFSEDLTDAIENVARGTPWGNAMRQMGKLYPNNPMSIGLGTAAPATAATMIFGPEIGVATGATAMGLGALGRYGATRSTERLAQIAELLARNGGDLPQAPLMNPETERLVAALLASQQAQQFGELPD